MRKFILLGIIVALLALPVSTVYAAPPPDGLPGLERAIAAQQAHNPRLLVTPGVVGTAVGLTADGRPAVKIFTETAKVGGLPASLDSIPVVVQVTGKFFAMKPPDKPDKPPSPGENNRNKPPQVTITNPADGDTFSSGEEITFTGTASDKEDKALDADSIIWKSNGNYLDQGGSISKILSDGSHNITAEVTDSGDKTAIDSITIYVNPAEPPPPPGEDLPPEVTITSPPDGATFDSGQLITFVGTATDQEDGNLTDEIIWNSSIEGDFGIGGSTDATLGEGIHTIEASVTDSANHLVFDSITITVLEPSTYSTTDVWPRAVPIGISTGNVNHVSAGTIACRVRDAQNVYALSNTHVYAPYAIDNLTAIGDHVMQPGRLDAPGQVYDEESHYLGTLHDYAPINGSIFATNYIDAAIALTDTSLLSNTTPESLGGYGIPDSDTVMATPEMEVQKFGRTTQLTKGRITGISGTILVGYGSDWFAWFDGQLIVESDTAFIQPGDSGSLLVTDDSNCSPVGLMFAGNADGTYALANQILLVLGEFGVSIDGK